MKCLRLATIFLVGALIFSACNGSPASPTPTQAPARQPTETSVPQPSAQPSSTAPVGTLVSNNGVEFTIPTGLGSGATADTNDEVPGVSDTFVFDVAPAYHQFTLEGYPVTKSGLAPVVLVYPAEQYALVNAGAADSVEKLKAIITTPSAPLTQEAMPWVYHADGVAMTSNMKTIVFPGLSGVRMLVATSGQTIVPVTNQSTYYRFYGLTSDGKYLVIVNLPVTAPFIQANLTSTAPSGGVAYPDHNADPTPDFDTYYKKVADLLNAAETANTISPSISLMDSLVQSLKLNSAGILLPTTQPTLAAQPSQTSAPAASSAPCDAAEYVADVTYPDGTQVQMGESFTKTWQIKNTGSCVWENYTLAFVNGDKMGAPLTLAIPKVGPGIPINVSIPIQAPFNKGTYTGHWVLKNGAGELVKKADGKSFNLWVKIVVNKENSSSGAATGVITHVTVTSDPEQGSSPACSKKATYAIQVAISANGPITATYSLSAISGQDASGIFSDSGTSEVTGSIRFEAADTKAITLRLVGPYAYPNSIDILVSVNGSVYDSVRVCNG